MSINNRVQLLGTAGKDPELKSFNNGGKVANFSVATNESYRDKNGNWVEITDWHNCEGWAYVADKIMKQVHKGCTMLIVGKLKTQKYQDKNNNTRYKTYVSVEELRVLIKKENPQNGIEQIQPIQTVSGTTKGNSFEPVDMPDIDDDDELPF